MPAVRLLHTNWYHEAQAREYHDAGDTLIPTAPEYAAGRQLGEGVYLTPRLHDWAGKRRDWFCAIYADADALKEVAKARIPEDLWFNDAAIDNYIAALGGESLVPRNTLRLGAIKGLRGKQQLVIPPGLLDAEGVGSASMCNAIGMSSKSSICGHM
ncbi:hypothetical protein ACCO45_000006 [Purpureocillium lilacinum]|uniref:Uncharacterized protein n=1 Tax=Purpureocillium lilacinum TaxID=33203 RepID=A0ACC4EBC8_PURLI